MEKSLLVSSYFDDLRSKARKIDEGIDRLAETWKLPQLLVGGYGGRIAETNAYLEELWEFVRSIAAKIEEFQSALEPSEETFLEESEAAYENLKEQCDNISSVLAEYDCHYKEDSIAQANDQWDDSKDQENSSILNSKEIPDIEVEFTPDLTWKRKPKSKESSACDMQQANPPIKCIATPVIKSLQLALQYRN